MPEPHPFATVLGDRRAMVTSALPPVLFVAVNALAGLRAAAVAAVALALVFIAERLVRRQPAMGAVGGLLATGFAVLIALRSGSAGGFFWPKLAYNAALAVACVVSVAVRRPAAALLAQAVTSHPAAWYADPRVRRPHAEVTLAFAALFALRAALYGVFIAADRTGLLAATSLVLGLPAFGLIALGALRWVPRRLHQLGAPPAPAPA